MAKSKRQPEERKPDLAVPDQDALEQRVHEMLDVEESVKQSTDDFEETPKSEPKKVEVQVIASAPELPSNESDANSKTEEIEVEPIVDNPEEVDFNDEPPEKIINLDAAPKDAAIIQESDLKTEAIDTSSFTDTSPETETEDEKLEKTNVDEVIDDDKTSKVVDEIIAKEGDELLEIEDRRATEQTIQKLGFKQRLTRFFKAWWDNPKARWVTIGILFVALTLIFVVPTSRYWALNSVGLRGNASITVLDESTGQPLKNVEVELADSTAKTGSDGSVILPKVKLGASELRIHKRAFAEIRMRVTVQLGSNHLAQARLKPTGVQYSFSVTDFLSRKPIEKIEASYGDASAISDNQGKIKLTVEGSQSKDAVQVSFNKEDYRENKLEIGGDEKVEQDVVMVYARRHMYISKRTGKFSIYSADIDAKNEKQLLEGTGSERDDIALSMHPTTSVAALVSTRDNKKNADGFLLSTLTIVEDQSDKVTAVVSGERIQLIDWIDDNLIYVQSIAGASATNPKRHSLVSYNYKTGQSKEIATSNYFNDVVVAGQKIYYAPSSANQPSGTAQLYRVNSDGSGKVTILNQEVWNIFRADFENLYLSVNKNWYNVRIGEDKATSINSQPTNPSSRIYVDSKDRKKSLWVDNRDGKGVLLSYETASRNEAELKSASGIKNPVYWLNNHSVVYRVSNEQETADYVLSLDGGEAKKISDVTNTNSIAQWYYY